MIQHTITPLPNGNFLWKLVADGKTVQTTELIEESARNLHGSLSRVFLDRDRQDMHAAMAGEWTCK